VLFFKLDRYKTATKLFGHWSRLAAPRANERFAKNRGKSYLLHAQDAPIRGKAPRSVMGFCRVLGVICCIRASASAG
jgi:hypothetical protein